MKGLPRPGSRGLRAFRLAWVLFFLSAVAAIVADQLHALAPGRLLHAALVVAAAAILFRRRRADPVAAMLSVAFLLWAMTRSLVWVTAGEIAAAVALLDKFRFALFVTAMLLFPSGRFEPRWTLHVVAATLAVATFGAGAVLGLAPLPLYTAMSMACAAAAVAALHRRYRGLPPGVQRQQIKWVAFGLGAGLVLVAVSRLMSLIGSGTDLVGRMPGPMAALLFDAGVIVMAAGFLAALLRFRLYDADAAISRSTVYAGLTIALLATFAASEAAIQALSQEWFGGSAGAVSGSIAAALAAAMIAPLHWRVSQWAERSFQKRLVVLRRELPSLLTDLRETVGLSRLAEAVLAHIEPAVRSSRAAILLNGRIVALRHVKSVEVEAWKDSWLPGDETALDCDDEDALFPCRVRLRIEGAGTVGWILVGGRPDATRQGRDEREALAESAGPVAHAMWIVMRREEDEAARDRLAARLGLLESSLSLQRQPAS